MFRVETRNVDILNSLPSSPPFSPSLSLGRQGGVERARTRPFPHTADKDSLDFFILLMFMSCKYVHNYTFLFFYIKFKEMQNKKRLGISLLLYSHLHIRKRPHVPVPLKKKPIR